MSGSLKAVLVLVLAAGLTLIGFGFGVSSQPKPYGPQRTYKLYNGAQQLSEFRGQEIRSNGLCIEVWLNGRVDTLACANMVITEAAATTGLPDVQLQPVQ